MATDILLQFDPPRACMFDDRDMRAFGPVVDGPNAAEVLAAFAITLEDDPRSFSDWQLSFKWAGYVAAHATDEPTTPLWEGDGATPEPEPTAMYEDTPGDLAAAAETAGDGAPGTLTTVSGPPASTSEPTADIPAAPAVVPDRPDGGAIAPVTPPDMPVGARICWACNGHRSEPSRPNEPCGICAGAGWLPA